MKNYPKIRSVKAIEHKRLLVIFCNDVKKIYDCTSLLEDDNFKPLLNDHFSGQLKLTNMVTASVGPMTLI